jgi:hypothetical protein
MAYISVRKTVANLPKEKHKLLFGLTLKIPDPVPKGILDPSVNQIKESLGTAESAFLQKSRSIMTLKVLE